MSSDNVKIAFALVFGAAASTGLGAAVVFFPSLVKLASRRFLAGSLSFSAGVMTYVSFIDLFGVSAEYFVEAGQEENRAFIFATLSFFGGVAIMFILDLFVHFILGEDGDHNVDFPEISSQHDFGHSDGGPKKLEPENETTPADDIPPADVELPVLADDQAEMTKTTKLSGNDEENNEELKAPQVDKKLLKMGLNTALAIGIHNFPEGLATFVATLSDPKVGAVVAVAIIVHNIPEGLCVALPVYYATGNRVKAFLWAVLSGASEVFAAFLGWLVLAEVFGNTTFAIIFGLVAGMMVTISVKELLPTAHQYDPRDTVATYGFVGGMALMALSLVLFEI